MHLKRFRFIRFVLFCFVSQLVLKFSEIPKIKVLDESLFERYVIKPN